MKEKDGKERYKIKLNIITFGCTILKLEHCCSCVKFFYIEKLGLFLTKKKRKKEKKRGKVRFFWYLPLIL